MGPRRRHNKARLCLAISLLVAAVAFLGATHSAAGISAVAKARPWWSRNFEPPERLPARYPYCCGPFWDTLLVSSTSAGSMVTDPTNSSNHVFSATAGPNDGHDFADWSMLTQNYIVTRGSNGVSAWVRLRFFFPSGFKPSGYTSGQPDTDWNWLAEFHEAGAWSKQCSSENPGTIAFGILNSRMRPLRHNPRFRLHVLGGSQTSSNCVPRNVKIQGPHVRLEHWYSLLIHVVFSPSSDGLVRVWLDRRLIARVDGPTIYRHPNGSVGNSYFSFGYYRLRSPWRASVLFDDVAEGPSRASVKRGR